MATTDDGREPGPDPSGPTGPDVDSEALTASLQGMLAAQLATIQRLHEELAALRAGYRLPTPPSSEIS